MSFLNRISASKQAIKETETAAELYKQQYGSYPTQEQISKAFLARYKELKTNPNSTTAETTSRTGSASSGRTNTTSTTSTTGATSYSGRSGSDTPIVTGSAAVINENTLPSGDSQIYTAPPAATPPATTEEKKDNTLYYILGGAAVLGLIFAMSGGKKISKKRR